VKEVAQLLIAASGWLYAWRVRRRASRINLVLDSKDGFAVLFNHSQTAIEVTGCSVELFDIFQPIGFGKKQTFLYPPVGLIKPGEVSRVIMLKSLEGTIEQWMRPEVEGLRRQGFEMPRIVGIRVYVFYRRADSGKVERARFARHLGGDPVRGWGLTYSPYHSESRRKRHFKRRVDFCWSFIKSPRAALKQMDGMKYLQRHLSVMSTLRAVQDKILTEQQAEKRLEKILKKSGSALAEEVKQHVESQQASFEALGKEGAKSSRVEGAIDPNRQ
jgi:hypothetical protein